MENTRDLREVRADTFDQALATSFRSRDPETVLILVGVTRYPLQPHAPRPEPFALIFTGEPALAQGMYSLEHPELGHLELFLVPIGPGPEGDFRYEAVFN